MWHPVADTTQHSHLKEKSTDLEISEFDWITSKNKSVAMESQKRKLVMGLFVFVLTSLFLSNVEAWTGEIRGRVVCDVCGDSSIGPEDHVLEGAEVAVLCITKSGEVLNYQAFTDAKGKYAVAETMPESDRWDACLARPIGSFHEHCTRLREGSAGVKFTYNHPSGYIHTIRPFVYRHASSESTYCI
ncbi:hypothetical protein LWI28_012031 [Acer negundo]|uniref:Pollen Ole e 1 allergen and extensin family protein n=1 Tax=Acer negundo TaxID=4023 RepID=A0AAD5J5I7_ACENE|nr:hypothetical protein LWI28_012031 [Acer negundo]